VKKATVFALWLALTLVATAPSGVMAESGRLDYPPTRTVNVIDTIHGVSVSDPYRWLEPSADPEVGKWTDAQDALTRVSLDSLPYREEIKKRLAELWNYPSSSAPSKHGSRYFFNKNSGLQNQAVLYFRDRLEAEPRTLIDPNTFSTDGTLAMDWTSISDDGTMIAYGVSASGSEDATLHVMNVNTREVLPLEITRCKYTSVAWEKDNSGFFYTRYPVKGTVPAGDENYYQRLYYHRMGTETSTDSLVYERPEQKELGIGVGTSEDSRYLIVTVYAGTGQTNELYYMDLVKRDGFKPIVTGFASSYTALVVEDRVFILTRENAPNFKVMVADMSDPRLENWKGLIPEANDPLQGISCVNRRLVLTYFHNAYSIVKLYSLTGAFEREIALPTLGDIASITGKWNEPEMFLSFSSFVYAPTIFRYHFDTDKLEIYDVAAVKINSEKYETHQVWYPSKDGTKISMFIVHKKGLKLDGSNPTLLYGYGGFSVNMTPYFSSSNSIWFDHGGVYAMPNLRGGNEYGERWHEAGMLAKKQNVFDDFIAAAEWLIANKYTSRDRLAIEGGSNGGLLTGAVMVQRPDLCKAVLCEVPLLDMIRYQNFLIARFWVPEYGSSEDSSQFKYLLAYSPYHNIKPNTHYPAALIKAGESDGRVDPCHARKFAAEMQAVNIGDNPILLWIERKAGHGQGKPISMQLDDSADNWAFLFWQLQMKW
jgi:prolyl oligopeptidase